MIEPEAVTLTPGEDVPNNRLPVLIYRDAGPRDGRKQLQLFADNGWGHGWRNGIFPFHHFHSTAHEVLGIARGEVEVRLGGAAGRDFTLRAGDVIVLPAGTGHRRTGAERDLEVVGAYPEGGDWDLIRADGIDGETYARAVGRITALPRPQQDPVYGAEGPLTRRWA